MTPATAPLNNPSAVLGPKKAKKDVVYGTVLTKAERAEIERGMDPLPIFKARTVEQWAEALRASWDRSVEATIAYGQLLIECKAALEYGQWLQALTLAQIDHREAQEAMKRASNPALANTGKWRISPPPSRASMSSLPSRRRRSRS